MEAANEVEQMLDDISSECPLCRNGRARFEHDGEFFHDALGGTFKCFAPVVSKYEGISAKPDWWTSDHWTTPPALVAKLEEEFGKFDLDPCCVPQTAKAEKFFTKEDDGLAQPWFGKVFLNPPYSKPGPWLQKTLEEISTGRVSLVVALIPASTDTKWFHKYVKDRAEIRFIEGRIRFHGWEGTPIGSPKQPNLFAVYKGKTQ